MQLLAAFRMVGGMMLVANGAMAQQLTQWETLAPNEDQTAQTTAQDLIAGLNTDYVSQHMRVFRDAHPRGIGCVAATFTVDPNLAQQYQTGVFAQPGQTFSAIIRFSSSLGPASDHTGDARGMAIKLLGVPGTKLLTDQPNAVTHDFLQINSPAFPAANTADFDGIVKVKGNPLYLFEFLAQSPITHALQLKNLIDISTNNPNNGHSLAEMQFFSMTPYLLNGPGVNSPIKFTSRPCAPVAQKTLNGSDTELRDDLQDRLTNGSLCYTFAVQLYVPNAGLSVEDASNVWSEDVAPFVPVATINIPQQTFRTDAKLHYCDTLSFQPWHALAQHQPLGNVNRARRTIYEAISNFRHTSNSENALLPEPNDLTAWNALTDPTYSVWNAIKVPAASSHH